MALASAAIPALDSPPDALEAQTDAQGGPVARAVSQADEALLAQLKVSEEASRSGYDRRLFRHWVDDDDDDCDAREEILIAESTVPAQVEEDSCKILSGSWLSEYDGKVKTVAGRVDVDHVVPLAEA